MNFEGSWLLILILVILFIGYRIFRSILGDLSDFMSPRTEFHYLEDDDQ